MFILFLTGKQFNFKCYWKILYVIAAPYKGNKLCLIILNIKQNVCCPQNYLYKINEQFIYFVTGHYDFSCPTCGKGFQCKSYLMVHQRVHSDVKPYPCTTCGRNFKTKQSLLDHTNRHLGVKPYICDVCGRGFITKG